MLRYLILTALSFSLLSACGGKKDDEEDKRPVEYCHDICEETADCEGAPSNYLGDCQDACDELARDANDAECLDEFETYAKCAARNFECEPEPVCDSQAEDYARCVIGPA